MSIGLGRKLIKGMISKKPVNNFEVGCHLGKFFFEALSQCLTLKVFVLTFYKLLTPDLTYSLCGIAPKLLKNRDC